MSCYVGEVTERLENELCYDCNYELCSFSNFSVTSPMSQIILQPFRRFTYPSVASPTSQLVLLPFFRFYVLILQPFRHFTYITAHSQTIPSLHLRDSSFSNPSVAFYYVTAHSPILPLLHLRHSSFSNPSFASLTSRALYLTSPREPPMSERLSQEKNH